MKMICNLPYNLWYKKKDIIQLFDTNIFCEIVNLSPIRWLQDPLAEYKKNSDWKKFENIRKHINDLEELHPGQTSLLFGADFTFGIGIYHITKKGGFDYNIYKNKVVDKVMKKQKSIPCTIVENVKKNVFVLLTTLDGGHKERAITKGSTYDLIRNEQWYGKYYINGKSTNGMTLEENKKRNKLSTCGNINKWACVEFDTEEEAENFYKYTKTKFFKYLYKIEMVDVNIHPQYLPFMPTYSHPWTDEMLYEFFELTSDEIKEIENCIK